MMGLLPPKVTSSSTAHSCVCRALSAPREGAEEQSLMLQGKEGQRFLCREWQEPQRSCWLNGPCAVIGGCHLNTPQFSFLHKPRGLHQGSGTPVTRCDFVSTVHPFRDSSELSVRGTKGIHRLHCGCDEGPGDQQSQRG